MCTFKSTASVLNDPHLFVRRAIRFISYAHALDITINVRKVLSECGDERIAHPASLSFTDCDPRLLSLGRLSTQDIGVMVAVHLRGPEICQQLVLDMIFGIHHIAFDLVQA